MYYQRNITICSRTEPKKENGSKYCHFHPKSAAVFHIADRQKTAGPMCIRILPSYICFGKFFLRCCSIVVTLLIFCPDLEIGTAACYMTISETDIHFV